MNDFASTSVESRIQNISLASLLQIVEMELKTCTVKVYSDGNVGSLYFINGELIDAKTNEFTGENAVLEIINWCNPVVEIRSECKKRDKNIHLPLSYMLLEGARIKDENNKKIKEQVMRIDETLFHDLASLPGFIAAGVYLGTGELVAAKASKEMDVSYLAGLAVELYKTAKSMAEKIELGSTDFVEIHTETNAFMHTCITPGVAALGVVVSKNGNMGLLKHEMRKLARCLVSEFKVSSEKNTLASERGSQTASDALQCENEQYDQVQEISRQEYIDGLVRETIRTGTICGGAEHVINGQKTLTDEEEKEIEERVWQSLRRI